MPSPIASVPFYDKHARQLAELYDRLAFEQLHQQWIKQAPVGGKALDVGCGSGRDACWLALNGWQVTAVEPASAMREVAVHKASNLGIDSNSIHWLDDSLPQLSSLEGQQFDLILVSAVWMHLSVAHRPLALRRLQGLMSAKGVLVLTLRNGPNDDERPMYPVSSAEIRSIARPMGLMVEEIGEREDRLDLLKRPDVRWQTLLIRKKPLRPV